MEGVLNDPAAYLTPREVAALLQVSRAAVYRLAKDDPTLPVLRLGGAGRPDSLGREGRVTLRFPRERLLVWLRSREQGAPQRASKLLLSAVGR
jgi:hypothetical protein